MDVRGFFDNINWDLLMRSVSKHTDCKWVLLYIERWLKTPVIQSNGTMVKREKGTPQGAVISPILANLFLHYTFDRWMRGRHPEILFERYADDIVCHCRSEEQARQLRSQLEARFEECQRELHPEKTKIVYCKDANRKGEYPHTRFDFLGYTFRPRSAMNRSGERFVSFSPAVSDKAAKRQRWRIRRWRLHRRNDLALEDIAKWVRPVLSGWVRYYGRFHRSAICKALRTIDSYLIRWAQRKYKRLRCRYMRVWEWLRQVKLSRPDLFAHWGSGIAVGQ